MITQVSQIGDNAAIMRLNHIDDEGRGTFVIKIQFKFKLNIGDILKMILYLEIS